MTAAYTLTIDPDGWGAVDFARGRYAWADTLWNLLDSEQADRLEAGGDVELGLSEPDAWDLAEALFADDGAFCPLLDGRSPLAAGLLKLWEQIV